LAIDGVPAVDARLASGRRFLAREAGAVLATLRIAARAPARAVGVDGGAEVALLEPQVAGPVGVGVLARHPVAAHAFLDAFAGDVADTAGRVARRVGLLERAVIAGALPVAPIFGAWLIVGGTCLRGRLLQIGTVGAGPGADIGNVAFPDAQPADLPGEQQ